VKTLASAVVVVLLTTAIGLLCLAAWTRMIDALLPGVFADISSENAHVWIARFVAGIVPAWIPAAVAFRWLWRRLVHQALSVKTTGVIYVVCVVIIPGLFYLFWNGVITHEEAIVLYVSTFLFAVFVVFRIHRGRPGPAI
jgi:hypothetical protein